MRNAAARVRPSNGRSALVLAAGWCLISGCAREVEQPVVAGLQRGTAAAVLRLATTTSTRDSGLLDALLPGFETAHRCRVDVIAVGTGAALRLGEAGDVDVLLVHARQAELAFMNGQHGTRHEEFMYNGFALLGPENDPAEIRDVPPSEALKRIAAGKREFFSRGDDSGTHQREVLLWKQAGGRREWGGYLEVGQGMGPTLLMADQKRGYTLADMGTYLKFKEKIDLVPLVVGAESLRNPYAAVVVNARKHEAINARLAGALVDYLISPETQRRIAAYRIAGRPLFTPTRLDDAR